MARWECQQRKGDDHDRGRPQERARAAAARGFDPRGGGHEVRPPDVLDVRSRPDGGARRRLPDLRLGQPGRRAERPPDLLEGPCVAAPLLALQALRRYLGRGPALVPQARLEVRGAPDAGPPVGGRGDRLARPGAADRRRRRARRQAARPAPVPRVGALRRQRAGRGLDVGGLRPRVLLRAGQPDRHPRHQPARADGRDDARLGPRPLRQARRGVRLARDRDRRTRPRGDRPRVRRGARDDRPPDRDRREDGQGQGRVRGREQGGRARQGARRPGRTRSRSSAATTPTCGSRCASRPTTRGRTSSRPARSSFRPGSSARRSRRGAPTATRLRRSARRTARSSRWTARSRTRPTPRSSAQPTRTGTWRCTSPSSR